MCLQGFDQSGQEQSVFRSPSRTGNRGMLAFRKISSSDSGMSPAIRRAALQVSSPTAAASFFQAAAGIGLIEIATRYGVGREPWTLAEILPGSIDKSRTCPLRA